MGWLLVGLVAAAFLAASLRPRARPAPQTSARDSSFVQAREHSVHVHDRPRSALEPDPFEVLRLQLRLGLLADEVRAIEGSPTTYGRMHHWMATQAAYDALLVEACALAGITTATTPGSRTTVPQGAAERFREEVELASRGWSW